MASLFSLSLVFGTRFLFPRKSHISPISGVFPGLHYFPEGTQEQLWARVGSPGAGEGSGLSPGAAVSWASLPLLPHRWSDSCRG